MKKYLIALAAATALIAGCAHKNDATSAPMPAVEPAQDATSFQNAKDRVSCKHAKKKHRRHAAKKAAPAAEKKASNEAATTTASAEQPAEAQAQQ